MSASDYYNGNPSAPASNAPQYPQQASHAAPFGNQWNGQHQPHQQVSHDGKWNPNNQQQPPYNGGYAPGPAQPQPGMSMQHSNSYGPPVNYAQGLPGQPNPNQYVGPPPAGGIFVQQPHNNQYQQHQQTKNANAGGFMSTCLAVCAGMCLFDMCCDCLF